MIGPTLSFVRSAPSTTLHFGIMFAILMQNSHPYSEANISEIGVACRPDVTSVDRPSSRNRVCVKDCCVML